MPVLACKALAGILHAEAGCRQTAGLNCDLTFLGHTCDQNLYLILLKKRHLDCVEYFIFTRIRKNSQSQIF